MRMYFIILSLFFCGLSFAQNTISGKVTDATNQPIPGVNVTVEGSSNSTSTSFDGSFSLKVISFPVTLSASMIGFGNQTLEVTSSGQSITIVLSEESTALNEIVISASRAPERLLESPVTIERMGLKDIKNTTAATFYDGLENLKDVHFNTSSFSFKSVNTRGFATVANTRFMQLVDGMDNSSPALNFVLGNLIGLSDIDVANVEILPGASSALYGANAFNGIMFMNSRSPFTKEGISTYFKYGRTSQKTAGDNPFYDFGIRAAKKFTKHFAAKANFSVLSANEWIASDDRNVVDGEFDGSGIGHNANINYDGLNTYGDEVTTNIKGVGSTLAGLGLIPVSAVNLLPNTNVSRTGYKESELTDNKIESVKADFSMHFKPWANDFEIIAQHKLGFGNTIYQGANRYAMKNFFMDQTKLEVKGKNFFVRGYMTTEDAGDSYDMRFAAWNVNRKWKSDSTWFGEYAGTYVQATLAGQTPQVAHLLARQKADTGRFLPGTSQFQNALSEVTQNADLTEGAKFKDQSKLYHGDANYNLKDLISFGEIQVGGSYRRYVLNSEGTIFTDFDGPLKYDEYGVYTQFQKKFADDRAKFTGSVRYDKSQNFNGSVSPRLSLTYTAGANKQHNFRGSYQTGFRNPTTQDQYIGLDLGPFALIGSAPENLARFVETRAVSVAGDALPGVDSTVSLSGVDAYNNSYGLSSVQAFSAAPKSTPAELVAAASLLKVATIGLVKPEQVQAIELGYRSIVEKMSIDISGYYNIYKDFLSQERVITPYYGNVKTAFDFTNPATLYTLSALANGDRRVYQVYTNSEAKISSAGFGIGLTRKVISNFEVAVSYNFADFIFDEASDPDFEPGFNTPKHRVKGSIGNDKLFKNFGFNTNVRWNSEYLWQSSFANGMVPENVVFDAQINYAIPMLKSVVKLGAANLGGKDYIQVVGAGSIGQQYYASWTINP
ncbi:TonB-dependent receptor domain-containing protein [Flavobacterium sp.]|uniref:TonB-dependent receptor domain-containing protein n=1 Tax=Flavobacterium sp. TaxID=239 RepID=UPI00286D832F|nr:TonB-dependent receptor [Flavobacterium sp.]